MLNRELSALSVGPIDTQISDVGVYWLSTTPAAAKLYPLASVREPGQKVDIVNLDI